MEFRCIFFRTNTIYRLGCIFLNSIQREPISANPKMAQYNSRRLLSAFRRRLFSSRSTDGYTDWILLYYDGIEMSFEADNVPHFKGNKKGRIYLTTHRVIFNSKDSKDMLQSFSMPFYTMKEVELEQPVFGANYIKGKVVSEQGAWQGVARFKMWFKTGGAIEFGQAMLRAGQLASRFIRGPLPPYTPPMGNVYMAPPPAYSPPHDPNYAWVPYQAFPTAPPADGVYTTDAPPPYPGVDPNMAPYPQPYMNGHAPSSADAKAQEASASTAYYNPANPGTVYMPPMPTAPYSEAPPSYSEATKKSN